MNLGKFGKTGEAQDSVRRFNSCTSPVFPKPPKFKIQTRVIPLFKNLQVSSKKERAAVPHFKFKFTLAGVMLLAKPGLL